MDGLIKKCCDASKTKRISLIQEQGDLCATKNRLYLSTPPTFYCLHSICKAVDTCTLACTRTHLKQPADYRVTGVQISKS